MAQLGNVPGVIHGIAALGVHQSVCARVQNFVDDVGAFLGRRELVHLLGILLEMKNKISNMKSFTSHPPTMVAVEALLVDDRVRESLFPRFLESIEVILSCCSHVFFDVGGDDDPGRVMKNIAR